jgi:hypothetical protein
MLMKKNKMVAVRNILLVMLSALSMNVIGQDNFLSLAGNWAFKIDSLNVGVQEEWFKQSTVFFDRQIKLPGTMDDAGYGNRVTIQPELKREVLLHLWRKVSYTGSAWYQKELVIPANWNDKEVKLFLERVLWKTNIWVDGKAVNEFGESLVTPHEFKLTAFLTPGKHIITMRIDNSRRYDISLGTANFAHAYTDETQIIWNGVIGKIALTVSDKIFFENVQVYPNAEHRILKIVSFINNSLNETVNSKIALSVLQGAKEYAAFDTPVVLKPGINEIYTAIKITGAVNQWDEFNPQMYQLKASLKTSKGNHNSLVSFGFRTISNANSQLKINNRLLFLRGTLECSIFPKEGHAPMEKAGWIRVFKIAKSYGLNHLRFHSWCPPEAAFEAADETGFYLQIELPVWTLKIGKDAAADGFLKAEADRMIKYYGNHPSFCFWSMGNEMQGDMQWLADEVTLLKRKDSRRLYTTTTFTFEKGFGTAPQQEDDFFVTQYTNKGWVRGQGIFDTESPTFNKDYNTAVDSLKVPLIIHEVGQYAVFPNMAELPKYTGVLRPVNFVAVQKDLAKKKMLSLAGKYTKASGKLAVLLYKEEIERALKTKGVSGFQLLDLHDFPGQGTALVGILDAFWESKGLITPENFRKFCSPVVPLIRFPKATYTNQENFTASIEIANFGATEIRKPTVKWEILNEAKLVMATGKILPLKIDIGNGINIGNINVALNKVATAQKLTVAVSIENTAYTNSWNIWVYPDNDSVTETGIVFSTDMDDAIKGLNEGKSVLLNPAKEKINGVEGKFVQVFWSPVHFPNQPGTMGLMIDPAHPAFKDFPTDTYSNWQWWDLCKNSTTLVLDSTGINASAIVLRAIDNFFKNRTMAGIIEAKVGKGKLIFCSMDINSYLANRPVAKQLRYSLIQYMKTNKFSPITTLGEADIRKLMKR